MGLTSSNQVAPEGEQFNIIINPGRKFDSSKLVHGVSISPRAKILKMISFSTLWDNFLNSPASSFALTQAEVSSLLLDSIDFEAHDGSKNDRNQVLKDIKVYIDLLEELSHNSSSKIIDFMAVCSSVLFLSYISIKIKSDQLFSWIVLDPESNQFSFDDFFLAMKSFERGLSHAMGFCCCSEEYVKNVSTQWMALADPLHKGSTDSHTRISNNHFFEFCTNRQHVVRRLLESLATAKVTMQNALVVSMIYILNLFRFWKMLTWLFRKLLIPYN